MPTEKAFIKSGFFGVGIAALSLATFAIGNALTSGWFNAVPIWGVPVSLLVIVAFWTMILNPVCEMIDL